MKRLLGPSWADRCDISCQLGPCCQDRESPPAGLFTKSFRPSFPRGKATYDTALLPSTAKLLRGMPIGVVVAGSTPPRLERVVLTPFSEAGNALQLNIRITPCSEWPYLAMWGSPCPRNRLFWRSCISFRFLGLPGEAENRARHEKICRRSLEGRSHSSGAAHASLFSSP